MRAECRGDPPDAREDRLHSTVSEGRRDPSDDLAIFGPVAGGRETDRVVLSDGRGIGTGEGVEAGGQGALPNRQGALARDEI
jgi:hypothetical protein